MLDKSVVDGTKKVYNSAEGYIEFADGDVEEDLFSFQAFENYWDYNDIKTWAIIQEHLSKTDGDHSGGYHPKVRRREKTGQDHRNDGRGGTRDDLHQG